MLEYAFDGIDENDPYFDFKDEFSSFLRRYLNASYKDGNAISGLAYIDDNPDADDNIISGWLVAHASVSPILNSLCAQQSVAEPIRIFKLGENAKTAELRLRQFQERLIRVAGGPDQPKALALGGAAASLNSIPGPRP